MFTNIQSQRFYLFFFFAVIFLILTFPVTSWAQWKLALPQFVLDGTSEDSEGLGVKAREMLKDEIQSTGLFLVVQESTYGDLAQKERAIKSSGKETFQVNYQAWHQVGVEWLVKTNYEVNKEDYLFFNHFNRFTFRLYDISNNRLFIGKRYTSRKTTLQKVIRRYADELVFRMTGKRGTAETRE